MSFTMAQIVNAGLPFNPLSSEDGQGHVYAGQNRNRLSAAMAENKWDDPRFVSAEEVLANRWALRGGAKPVSVLLKEGDTGQWTEKLLYNAAQVWGMPALAAMLQSALVRLLPEDDLALSVSRAPVQVVAPAPVLVSGELAEKLAEEEEKKRIADAALAEEIAANAKKAVQQEEVGAGPGLSWEGDALLVVPVVKTQGHDAVLDGRATPEYVPVPVLGRVFKELTPGSGEYVRDGEKKFSFKDKGDSLVIRDKRPDSFQGVMELAKAKGWESIELSGKPEHIAQGWLEAQLMGIQVANFTPTEKDRAALEERRKGLITINAYDERHPEHKAMMNLECDKGVDISLLPTFEVKIDGLMHKAQEKTVPDGAKLVTVGRHIGVVVDIVDGFAIQDVGRGEFKAHALGSFEKVPQVGEKLDLQYRDGKARVVEPLAQGQAKERSR